MATFSALATGILLIALGAMVSQSSDRATYWLLGLGVTMVVVTFWWEWRKFRMDKRKEQELRAYKQTHGRDPNLVQNAGPVIAEFHGSGTTNNSVKIGTLTGGAGYGASRARDGASNNSVEIGRWDQNNHEND